MSTYRVRAKHWDQGWELHVDGVGVTQVRLLKHAEQQARDLIETMTDADASTTIINLHVDLGGLEDEVRDARQQVQQAQAAQVAAATRARDVVRALRTSEGLSVSDVATLLAVSRGRVSQLSNPGRGT